MKFGVADYGMNVWHGGLYSVEDRLESLRNIGFDGIERIEAISASDALERAVLYHKMGMDFATCRGPNVQSGLEWTCGLGKEYVWLTPGPLGRDTDMEAFLRRAREFTRVCARFGVKAALHNHMDQRIENQQELEMFLKECPDTCLLLDTGHFSAAGGNVVEIVEKYSDRIVAMHLKDVLLSDGRDENGRAKAWKFCELGAGNDGLNNAAVMQALVRKGFDGWVMIEHDHHVREPLVDLKTSLDYLRAAGIKK